MEEGHAGGDGKSSVGNATHDIELGSALEDTGPHGLRDFVEDIWIGNYDT